MFHVNIITASEVMTISFYKELTKNTEIKNTPVWVLPNIWKLGQVDTNVSNKILTQIGVKVWLSSCKKFVFFALMKTL